MKPIGSITFGTNQIRTEEYILLAKVMKDNGSTAPQIALEIEALDDMLTMQKMHSIITSQRFTKTGKIRKNSSFSDWIASRIGILNDSLQNLKKSYNRKRK